MTKRNLTKIQSEIILSEIVVVKWEDDETNKEAKKQPVNTFTSVGHVVSNTKKYLTIASTVPDFYDPDCYMVEALSLAWNFIKEVHVLKECECKGSSVLKLIE